MNNNDNKKLTKAQDLCDQMIFASIFTILGLSIGFFILFNEHLTEINCMPIFIMFLISSILLIIYKKLNLKQKLVKFSDNTCYIVGCVCIIISIIFGVWGELAMLEIF